MYNINLFDKDMNLNDTYYTTYNPVRNIAMNVRKKYICNIFYFFLNLK